MLTFLKCFDEAFEHYQRQSDRPGYLFGWLSSFRHSNILYPHIHTLQADLKNASDADQAKSLLQNYFKSPQTKLNNHSFAIYLLDVLSREYPDEGWDIYYPMEKSIVFYSGILYRGTLQTPDDALENGITSGKSRSVEDYAHDTNMHTGVSTSKNKKCAGAYQDTVLQTPTGAYRLKGYLYEIDYRGIGGIDIIETLKKRGRNITAAIASHKEEVNVIGTVKPEDIVGYWDQSGKYIANPGYDQNREPEQVESFSGQLTMLFKNTSTNNCSSYRNGR